MKQPWRKAPDSDHYKNGRFINLSPTPNLAPGVRIYKVFQQMLTRPSSVRPASPVPFVRRDLKNEHGEFPVITWFGHSSYLIQSRGFNILVDPVFSGHASPFSWMIRAFEGADVYKPGDMPDIDVLIITHNHYDHLSPWTIRQLWPRIKQVVTPLCVGKDILPPGKAMPDIIELDWWEAKHLETDVTITATPARHFSGRGLTRNESLWASFVVQIHGHRLFIGGDSGYDTFFTEIGQRFGPFDVAMLECGQYNESWSFIHVMPEEVAQAGRDLQARMLLPVHWGKFTLANHPWTEPIERLLVAASRVGQPVVTPMIGEAVSIGKIAPIRPWWRSDPHATK